MLVLTSCQTYQKNEEQNPVNDLYWPEFPSPELNDEYVVQYSEEKQVVTMPLWYWTLIVEYVVDIVANIEILTGFP